MDSNCIFCKIIAGEIPAQFVHRDEDIVAIADVNPQAPTHVLVMPVRHVPNLPEFAESEKPELIAKLLRTAGELGRQRGADGFRAVINTGRNGGQTVDHLHIHVLAGRHLTWPPG
ncbi:MAG: histidine triad nucleotide-binding protein [Vulcanimicrobiaceae bacterium]